jgi:glycosyltransferase involved in cell wall biosynthesis
MVNKLQPLVTIVTPSYNQGQFIEETILSVLSQTYQNIEYIIVDGGSTDNTMEVVNKYKDKISVIIHEKDKGQSDAINKGFKLANGVLTGWLNSDDILYNDCVEEIVGLYEENPNGAIYYGSKSNFINETGKILKLNILEIPNRDYLLNQNYSVIQQGSFYKALLVKECNYLNEKIHYCMDLDLWLRLLNLGPIYSYQIKPLAAFRIWADTKTTNGKRKFLKDIRKTLLKNGANMFSKNIIQTYFYEMKHIIKFCIGFK